MAVSTSAPIRVRLLGDFELTSARAPAPPIRRRMRALVALIALAPPAGVSRDRLATILWGERDDEQARGSLRQALAELRRVLGDDTLHADRDRVTFDPVLVETDAVEFQNASAAGRWEEAATLYRGDLLAGESLPGGEFDDWLRTERAHLRELAIKAIGHKFEQEQGQAAIASARQLLRIDPANEPMHRALMSLYAANGDHAAARKQYRECREALARELNVQPDAETRELDRAIQTDVAGYGRLIGEDEVGTIDAVRNLHSSARLIIHETAPGPVLALPDKPSIAVLPFQNMSGDPEQEYFADGMVEEITIALSRVRWLFVIARNSSFAYKGRAVDVRRVARELGVRYVLEGSVRKAANRVRITGQLIDASTGAHLWADRFDGEIANVFELQDQVTSSVVGAIAPKLEQAEIERAKRKPTDSLDAYDLYLRGVAAFHLFTREGHEQARAYFHKAIQVDPDFASALGMAARCYVQRQGYGWVVDRAAEMAEVARLARQAAEAGKEDAVALCSAGLALAAVAHEINDGAALVDRALVLNPNFAWAWLSGSWVKIYLGEPEVAIERASRAMRLSPQDPQTFAMQTAIAAAHFFAGRDSEALSWAQMAMREQPKFLVASCVAAASAGLSARPAEAQQAMIQLRRLNPGLRISNLHTLFPLQTQDFARWTEGLRRAGLPEQV